MFCNVERGWDSIDGLGVGWLCCLSSVRFYLWHSEDQEYLNTHGKHISAIFLQTI